MSNTSDESVLPAEGALLGIDFGTKRLGLAVCNREQTIASPVETLMRRSDDLDARRLRTLVDDYRVVGLVVGLPVHMSGDEGQQAAAARAFGEWIAGEVERPVAFWDERHTSQKADVVLFGADLTPQKRQELRDRLAAQAILQSYLDAEDKTLPPPDLRGE